MQECVEQGCTRDGVLSGGLNVKRRATELRRALEAEHFTTDPLRVMDWVTLFALAVNEENANGGRVVTAPTNGAAGIIPAVLHYYTRFVPGAHDNLGLTCDPVGGLVQIPLHRAQRGGEHQGDHRGPAGAARRRQPLRIVRQGARDDAADRCGHEGEVQGDGPRRSGGQCDRVLKVTPS
jgi:hypothetical protein